METLPEYTRSYLALRNGQDPSRIIFNGPVKRREDVELAVRNGSLVQLDSWHELELVRAAAQLHPTKTPRVGVRVNVDLQPRAGTLSELNLIGNNVDEALTRLERFFDDALVSESRTLRIVHGYGTGQLRRAVADFLKSHPLVESFGPAPDNQGAGGATVVELKE